LGKITRSKSSTLGCASVPRCTLSGHAECMAIDLSLSAGDGDSFVATISEPLLEWMNSAATVFRVGSPFGRFDPYGLVILRASMGEVASFASAVERFRNAMTTAEPSAFPSLPVIADERDSESGQLDQRAILQLLASTLEAAQRADAANGAIVGAGE
jgi:hypothetical protein